MGRFQLSPTHLKLYYFGLNPIIIVQSLSPFILRNCVQLCGWLDGLDVALILVAHKSPLTDPPQMLSTVSLVSPPMPLHLLHRLLVLFYAFFSLSQHPCPHLLLHSLISVR